MRNYLWRELEQLGGAYLNGSITHRIAGNLNISFDDINSEVLIAALKDLALSTSAACTLKDQTSYVLQAIGIPAQLVNNAIRISFGRFTTHEDINFTAKHIKDIVSKIRATD